MRRQLSVVLVLACVSSVCPVRAAAAAEIVLRPPTDAAVRDPFRLPDGHYGAGNRGIEYDTRPDDTIRAAGPGIVVFAGPVAGSLHVTVDHGHGLLTSYSFLAALTVRRGDTVGAGSVVGRAGGPTHFGARIEGVYVDPAGLFGVRRISVVLVPHDESARFERWLDGRERSERASLLARFGTPGGVGLGGLLGAARSVLSVAGGWHDPLRELADLARLVDLATEFAVALSPADLVTTLADVAMAVFWPPPCSPGGSVAVRPPGRRVAIVVNGLGSSSGTDEAMAALDLGAHGYRPGDTVRFSYEGGIVDDGHREGWQSSVPASSYGPTDTHPRIAGHIVALASTLRAVAAANPGVPIDVFGHSLGGLATRHAIAGVGGEAVDVDIGIVVTLAAPHSGAAMALAGQALVVSEPGRRADRVADIVAPGNPIGEPIIDDLSEAGFAGDTAAVAFPDDVHAVTIADRGDLVVPAGSADAPGAHHITLGGAPSLTAHSDLPGLPAVGREIELALAGMPPTCSGVVDRVADVVQPAAIDRIEHEVGAAVLVGGLVAGGA